MAAIVLAAGASKRFASENKLLADIDGRSVIESVFTNVAQCGFDEVFVVIAPAQSKLATLVETAGFTAVDNPHPELGMGSSIACGIRRILDQKPENFSGVAVFLGDMPSIGSDISHQLTEEFDRANGKNIVRPISSSNQESTPGHPVLFPAEFLPMLASLTGDSGAKGLIDANLHRLIKVNVPDASVTRDIDYPSDLSGR